LAFLPNPLPAPPNGDAAPLAAPTILSIGRLNRQKAHDVLLRGFAEFAAAHPEWRLAIMGEGPEEVTLRGLASRLGIAERIDWLGRCEDPYRYLQACRVFVLVSRHEGMPNALLEAMSCGMPCIVSDGSPGPLELIQDGINGLVVPVEDATALAKAVESLVADRRFADTLGNQARETVRGHAPSAVVKVWDEALGLTNSTQGG
jgi:glycosyltransferase involved in cell wall biosynthesis